MPKKDRRDNVHGLFEEKLTSSGEAKKGLVTYGDNGELLLLDAAGPGKKLGGPTEHIRGVQYVER